MYTVRLRVYMYTVDVQVYMYINCIMYGPCVFNSGTFAKPRPPSAKRTNFYTRQNLKSQAQAKSERTAYNLPAVSPTRAAFKDSDPKTKDAKRQVKTPLKPLLILIP